MFTPNVGCSGVSANPDQIQLVFLLILSDEQVWNWVGTNMIIIFYLIMKGCYKQTQQDETHQILPFYKVPHLRCLQCEVEATPLTISIMAWLATSPLNASPLFWLSGSGQGHGIGIDILKISERKSLLGGHTVIGLSNRNKMSMITFTDCCFGNYPHWFL